MLTFDRCHKHMLWHQVMCLSSSPPVALVCDSNRFVTEPFGNPMRTLYDTAIHGNVMIILGYVHLLPKTTYEWIFMPFYHYKIINHIINESSDWFLCCWNSILVQNMAIVRIIFHLATLLLNSLQRQLSIIAFNCYIEQCCALVYTIWVFMEECQQHLNIQWTLHRCMF